MNMLPSHFPVTSHTKYVGPGSIFVAIKGYKEHGIGYIQQALALGAKTIVVQDGDTLGDDIVQAIKMHQASLLHVENTRKALAELSAQAAGMPAKKLRILGVTGTKGKTSTSFLLEHILRVAGYKTALMGTVTNRINGQVFSAELTTPQPDYLQQFLKVCVDQGVEYVVMEVAAQALTLHRINGIQFDGAIFTNFSQEHAEFYTTMDDYFAAKKQILNHLKPCALLWVNADDTWCERLLPDPRVRGFSLIAQPQGVVAECVLSYQGQQHLLSCPALIGLFNCYNILAAASLSMSLGISYADIDHGLKTFAGVPGRMERYELPNGALGIIDYAHNPASCAAVLSTLRVLTDQLIVVFGCGGDRDASKRPVMGAIAAQIADKILLTSDNPRSENPADIINAIYAGIDEPLKNRVICELDREKAIRRAYELSHAGAIIALLGKGPDEYQHIGSVKYPFSEKMILQSLRP